MKDIHLQKSHRIHFLEYPLLVTIITGYVKHQAPVSEPGPIGNDAILKRIGNGPHLSEVLTRIERSCLSDRDNLNPFLTDCQPVCSLFGPLRKILCLTNELAVCHLDLNLNVVGINKLPLPGGVIHRSRDNRLRPRS